MGVSMARIVLSDELFLLVLCFLAAQKEKNITVLFQLNILFAYIAPETPARTNPAKSIYQPQGCHPME